MGQHFSSGPSGFQAFGVASTNFSDVYDSDIQDFWLKKSVSTGFFIGLLVLLSWWYSPFLTEKRFDPIEAANKERDTAIQERNEAQRAWGEMGARYEQAMKTILELQAELTKASKDLPWLSKRNFELAEENVVQYNEIERLKKTQQDYDDLLDQVATHGMTAKRPEHHQKISEEVQRALEISNHSLHNSQKWVQALEEKLVAEQQKVDGEKEWLRARLKRNARSVAYWARFRRTDQSKPAWGVRCACTESEIAYHNAITESQIQIAAPTLVHACQHEQQCKDLTKQVADDAIIIQQLRKECQGTKGQARYRRKARAGNEMAAVRKSQAAHRGGQLHRTCHLAMKVVCADFEHELGQQRTNISILENTQRELEDTIKAKEHELGQQRTNISMLENTQRELEDTIKAKEVEIEELEKTNQEMAEQPAQESAENLRRLKTANASLEELRRQIAESKELSENQTVKIRELEDAARESEAASIVKDDKIVNLEQQIAGAPTIDSIERQTQAHNEAITKKDDEYRALYNAYQEMLGQQQRAEAKHNEEAQAVNTLQQNYNARSLELQRLWTEFNNFRNVHVNCNGRINDLTNQLRQGADTYTDLQIKYNTQATKLEAANQNASELRNLTTNLQEAKANLEQMSTISAESDVEKYCLEGENRARPIWQANLDRELSARTLKLEESERTVFKLQSQLQQMKTQATPLREMQLKSREDAVKLREDALKLDADAMDHDQQASKADPEIKKLESALAAANKEAGDAKARNRGIQNQLTKERKELKDEKERHERELKKEREESERKGNVLRIRLEKDNPLKGTVSQLQDELARLKKEMEQKARD